MHLPLDTRDPAAWAARLRSVAALSGWNASAPRLDAPAPQKLAFITAFRDEAGHRRTVDRYLLARLLRVNLDPITQPEASPEVALWQLAAGFPGTLHLSQSGRLFPHTADKGIEVWTEMELCGVHALSWLALRDEPARERLESAIDWLLAEVEPDNGTNHPWAVHVMAHRWITRGDTAARLYAETLEHACQMQQGRPDLFSAAILLDAASWLDR